MTRVLISLVSFLLTLSTFVAQISGDARTTELLAKAREALGGASRLANVQGLSAIGAYTRALPTMSLTGELTLDLQLPDKMLRTESMNAFGDATMVTLSGINGDHVLRNSRTIGGGPNMVIRMAPPPAPGSDAEAQALKNGRAELARLALTFLLTAPSSSSLEFSYGGEAEAEDGKADVLDVKGSGAFVARLFLDKTSHRPLMLGYKGVAPGMVMRTQQVDGHTDTATIERAARDAAAAAPPPQLVDISLFVDNYKQVDGVWLPHHVSRSIDGKPSEEWTFKTIKVNPAFKPDAFSAK
jgi:hypothetical protein